MKHEGYVVCETMRHIFCLLNITINVYWKTSNIFLRCRLRSRQSGIIRVKSIAGIETSVIPMAGVSSVTPVTPVTSVTSMSPGLFVSPGLVGCQPLVRWEERSEGKLRLWSCSLLIISFLGAVYTGDSGGKPPGCGQLGEVVLILLVVLVLLELVEMVEMVVGEWREGNLGLRLGLTPGGGETNTEQHQKLHSDYLVCLSVTGLWRESDDFYIDISTSVPVAKIIHDTPEGEEEETKKSY